MPAPIVEFELRPRRHGRQLKQSADTARKILREAVQLRAFSRAAGLRGAERAMDEALRALGRELQPHIDAERHLRESSGFRQRQRDVRGYRVAPGPWFRLYIARLVAATEFRRARAAGATGPWLVERNRALERWRRMLWELTAEGSPLTWLDGCR